MFENKLIKNLKQGEQVIKIVRKYLFIFTGPVVLGTILIIASFFFLYPLFRQGGWGVAVFFLVLGAGILLILRVFVVYSFNVFIVTNYRIIDIDQRGFFDRTVSETTYDKIQDVSFRLKGLMQTMLHYGSIIIQTAGAQANIELHGVKDPEKIQQAIIETQKISGQENNISKQVKEFIAQIKDKSPDKGRED